MTPITAPATTIPITRTVAGLRSAIADIRDGGSPVALVPTMGALHDGHLSLVARGRDAGFAPVLTIFVNPTQFGPGEDLDAYPRGEARDLALAAEVGVVLAFCPGPDEVYGDGFATTVAVAGPSGPLEGAIRPTHFAGVATVVAKLLLMARPDRLVLGQKDAQQVAVVRRMMRDLHLDDVSLDVGPIIREADGLALSSRNAYLSPDERVAATVLSRSLCAAERAVRAGTRDGREIEDIALTLLAAEPRCRPEYVALVDGDTFEPVPVLDGTATLCVAAHIGPARLIDNVILDPSAPNP